MTAKIHTRNRREAALVAALVLVCLALRLYRLKEWLLPNVDEIALISNIGTPIFSGGYGSTTFFPAVQITKYLFPFLTFPDYRYIGVLFNTVAMLLFYAGLRRFVRPLPAFLGSLLFCMQWYLVYISRMYEIATFIPFFFAAVFYCFALWSHTGRHALLPPLFLIGGIGFDCYAPPMAYGLASLLALLAYQATKKTVPWKWVGAGTLCLFIALLPFFYVQLYVGNFLKDVLTNYNFAGHAQSSFAPIHLQHPEIFLKTLTELLTFLSPEQGWKLRAGPAMLLLLLPLPALLRSEAAEQIKLLAAWCGLTCAAIFLSPVAAYIQGHFTGFFMLYIACLSVALATPGRLYRCLALAALLGITGCSLYWLPKAYHDQYSDIAWLPGYLKKNAVAVVPISDGSYNALKHTPFLNGARFEVFTCDKPENILAGLKTAPPADIKLVFGTFDCNIVERLSELGLVVREQQEIMTLFESHYANGLRVYFVEKK